MDSADTWAHPELFQLDEENVPVAVAGCPPDGFSATGQLWGNTSAGMANEMTGEAVQALVALGYGNTEALKAVRQVEITEEMSVEDVLRQSLKYML